jgi:hypothetical protein
MRGKVQAVRVLLEAIVVIIEALKKIIDALRIFVLLRPSECLQNLYERISTGRESA